MRAIALIIGIGLALLGPAHAVVLQCGYKPKINYRDANLILEWADYADPAPTGIRIKYGTATRTYTAQKDLTLATFEPDVETVFPGPGAWYFIAIPLSGTTEVGIPSDECFFDFGIQKLRISLRIP